MLKKSILVVATLVLGMNSFNSAFASTDQFQICGPRAALRELYYREIQGGSSSGTFTLPEITQLLSTRGQVALDHYAHGTFSSPYTVSYQTSCVCVGLDLMNEAENGTLAFRMIGGSPGAECLPRSHHGQIPTIRI